MSTATEAGAEGQGRNLPRENDYLQWPTRSSGGPLNRWSHAITREHDYPAAKVSSGSAMLLLLLTLL